MALDSMVYGVDNIATHSFSEGSETRHVERVAPASGVLGAWEDTAEVTATGSVYDFSVNTSGRGRIVVGCLARGSQNTTCKFRLIFKNSDDEVVGLSAEAESRIAIFKEGSINDYLGTITVFSNDVGASSVGVYVTALPAGATMTMLQLAAI